MPRKATVKQQLDAERLKVKELDLKLSAADEQIKKLKDHFGVTDETKFTKCPDGHPLYRLKDHQGVLICETCTSVEYLKNLPLFRAFGPTVTMALAK